MCAVLALLCSHRFEVLGNKQEDESFEVAKQLKRQVKSAVLCGQEPPSPKPDQHGSSSDRLALAMEGLVEDTGEGIA